MKPITYFPVLFLAVGWMASCTSDDSPKETPLALTEPLETENLQKNISYGADADQVYDIYLPVERTEMTKILILVHGGGWTSGDKADMNGFKDFLRDQLQGKT
jgi:acetyl esterase/lipase